MIATIAQTFAEIIGDEDYGMGESQQLAANAGSLDRWIAGSLDRWIAGSLDQIIFGRNERALHHYHATYAAELGTESLALLDAI